MGGQSSLAPWVLLVIAGLLEVVWATTMKQSAGFSRLWPSVVTLGAMVASFVLLARAMSALPLGVSYTVWVGIGAVGSVIAGWALLGERLSALQIVCIVAIAAGIVGLKVGTKEAGHTDNGPHGKGPNSSQEVRD